MTWSQRPAPETFVEPEHTLATFEIKPDCRHFVGGLPCRFWRPCHGCPHHDPVSHRVLIVMLGLLGDMLIASPLPARLKRDRPGTHITWLVDQACAPVLRMNPYVDQVLPFDWQAATRLPSQHFDEILSFERTPAAAALVDRIPATRKAGLAFGGQHHGLYPMGDAAGQFFMMNTWNDYRTRGNTMTWTELYFAVAGYEYAGEPYVLAIPEAAERRARTLFGHHAGPRICLNLGGSLRTKLWPVGHWAELGTMLLEHGAQLAITGGPTDTENCERLHRHLQTHADDSARVVYAPLSIEEFSALPAYCDVVVTGDTFGFHLALAHQRPTVLLLGPSNGAEVIPKHIDTVTPLHATLPCSPCAHQVVCGGAGGCMDTIGVATVLTETLRHLRSGPATVL